MSQEQVFHYADHCPSAKPGDVLHAEEAQVTCPVCGPDELTIRHSCYCQPGKHSHLSETGPDRLCVPGGLKPWPWALPQPPA